MARTVPARHGESGRTGRMSYEEFLAWLDEDTLAEWVDGAVEMASPASRRHQNVVKFLATPLSFYADVHRLRSVILAPFQMKLARSGREPDLLFVASAHRDRIKETYLDGAADLVIEVVSPESAGRDRGDKFYEYREAGIPEHWPIDLQLDQAELYQLDAQGRYQTVPPGANGVYRSKMARGFWINTQWLWLRSPPDTVEALLQIDRDAYAAYLRERLRQAGV